MEFLNSSVRRGVEFHYFSNTDQEKEIRGYYDRYSYLIPPWITRISIIISQIEGGIADISVREDYMLAKIRLDSNFFDNTAEFREHAFKHELCHTITSVLSDWCFEVIANSGLPDNIKDLFNAERKNRLEKVTEWMAQIVKEPDDLSK